MEKPIFLSPPWVDKEERNAISHAFDTGYVAPCGPLVDAFDARLGALAHQHAAAVSAGTAALDLLMAELQVGPQTIVVASSLTFIATIGPALHRGAQPFLIDCDHNSGTLSCTLLERALQEIHPHIEHATCPTPAVVIAADIYGQCCNYERLEKICARFNVPLIIDAAESLGATAYDRPAGLAGQASVYSFNGNKIITTSGGGAVLSRDEALVARARWRAQQAREKVVWYEHKEVGYNYRLSNLLAGVGLAQLEKLPRILARKKRNFDFYCDLFSSWPISLRPHPFPCGAWTKSSHWLSVFIFPSFQFRNHVARLLTEQRIETRPVWKPLHLQPVLQNARVKNQGVAKDLFMRGLCLSSGAGLTEEDLTRIARTLTAARNTFS